jgi:chemotaxis protein CheX
MQNCEIIRAIHNVTAELFSMMIGLELEPGVPRIDRTSPSVENGVMAIVGITGPWVGTGIISCSSEFACLLSNAFLMTDATVVNEEVLDAVGELGNMIIGNFKNAAEAAVGPLKLTVPTVIAGKTFLSKSLRNNDWIVMPFKSGDHSVEVRIWFAPVAPSQVPAGSGSVLHHSQLLR